MVIDWLVEGFLGSFLERLDFLVLLKAELTCNHSSILAAGLQLGCFSFLLLAGELGNLLGSTIRVMA